MFCKLASYLINRKLDLKEKLKDNSDRDWDWGGVQDQGSSMEESLGSKHMTNVILSESTYRVPQDYLVLHPSPSPIVFL